MSRVLFLQLPDSGTVVLQLLRAHPHEAVIIPGEVLGCVVGESENVQTAINGSADKFFLGALGMVAPGGVAVVIGDHGKASLLETARRFLRAEAF